MKKYINFIIILVLGLSWSCSTDFDVNAKWKDVSVVYGILNLNDTVHYVKINKAFLGKQSAYTMAKNSDSLNYDNIKSVYIQQGRTLSSGTWDAKPNSSKIYLKPTTNIQKDTGIFANDNNMIYFTNHKLDIDNKYNEYKLEIDITGKDLVTSSTKLFNELTVINPKDYGPQPPNSTIKNSIVNFATYTTSKAEWYSTKDARIYELIIRFYYYETDDAETELILKHLDWTQANKTSNSLDGGEKMQIEINGESFFEFVASKLEPLPEGRKRISRRNKALDYIFLIGGQDLYTYIQVSSPSNTIVQEKPSYTNINNGLGIFSSRFNKTQYNIRINERVIDSLAYSKYTRHLGFVSRKSNFYSNNPEE